MGWRRCSGTAATRRGGGRVPGRRGAGALLLAVAVASAGATPACRVASPAPASARLSMEAAQRDPHGAWINIATDRGGVAGELLAVEPRAVIVQTSAGFQRVPAASIRS